MRKATRRLIILFIALILLASSFTACGRKEPVPVEVGFDILRGPVPPAMYREAFEIAVRIENNTYEVGQDIPITIYYGVWLGERELENELDIPINISLDSSCVEETIIVKSYTPDEIFVEEYATSNNFETNKKNFKHSIKTTIPSWWFAEESGAISVDIGQEYSSDNKHNDGYGYVKCGIVLIYEVSDGLVVFPWHLEENKE